jgi:hypothetical protein
MSQDRPDRPDPPVEVQRDRWEGLAQLVRQELAARDQLARQVRDRLDRLDRLVRGRQGLPETPVTPASQVPQDRRDLLDQLERLLQLQAPRGRLALVLPVQQGWEQLAQQVRREWPGLLVLQGQAPQDRPEPPEAPASPAPQGVGLPAPQGVGLPAPPE